MLSLACHGDVRSIAMIALSRRPVSEVSAPAGGGGTDVIGFGTISIEKSLKGPSVRRCLSFRDSGLSWEIRLPSARKTKDISRLSDFDAIPTDYRSGESL